MGIYKTAITSSPSNGYAYMPDETIKVKKWANEDVSVNPYTEIALQVGGQTVGAVFLEGNEGTITEAVDVNGYARTQLTEWMVFGYTVQDGDFDGNGVSVPAGNDDDGFRTRESSVRPVPRIYGGGNHHDEINKHYPGVATDDTHRVGVVSTGNLRIVSSPASGDIYNVGETIEFRMDFPTSVQVDGSIHLNAWLGSSWKGARYLRGSGTNRLVFGYAVRQGDWDPCATGHMVYI